jgi:hypothetical protein
MAAGQRVLATAVRTCRIRHGWSNARTRRAINVAGYSNRMVNAARELRTAGVDMEALRSVYEGFSAAEREMLAAPANDEESERVGVLIATRTLAGGIVDDSAALVAFLIYSARVDREARLFAAGE